ncbi:hemerythrin domain-containing protein [Streptomyces sp. NPDC012751]|uniref:hemerythrin domain-containing protein n=1 Tax=Streptomyces sp. NPDC012751 TaxID=3364846 RepID=UPI0036C86DD1
MPSRSEVLRLLAAGLDYAEAGRRLGVPAGQAFLIATGLPADGGGALTAEERRRPGMREGSTGHLSNPPARSPAGGEHVRAWLRERAGRDGPLRRAAEARDVRPEGDRAPEDVRELTGLLTRDHDRVTSLVEQLNAVPGGTKGGSAARAARRETLVGLIAEALASHEPAERQHLWPAVRDALEDGDRLADQALEQESGAARTLARLERTAPDTEESDHLAQRLTDELRRHVAFEDAVFARLRKTLSEEERERLGAKVARAWTTAPDRAPDARGARPADRRGTEREE